jgi:hypothetical protein
VEWVVQYRIEDPRQYLFDVRQVSNHGVDRLALIKAYDVLVKTPEERKKLEISAPLLVAARDKAVVEQKRERLQQELAARSARQSNSMRI